MNCARDWRRVALVVALVLPMSATAQDSAGQDPWDPDAEVPPSEYMSVFTGQPREFAGLLNAPQLPWKGLYESDGRFVSESALQGMNRSSSQMSAADSSEPMSHENMGHGGTGAGMNMSADTSDARGVIKKIYLKDGKLKLKHGPIDRLGMPGMTMIFYLKEPALAKELEEGQEVDFDVKMEGTTFFITRIKR